MISLRVLSTAAVMALVLPMAAPTASFAQMPVGRSGGGGRCWRRRWRRRCGWRWRRWRRRGIGGGGGGVSIGGGGGAPIGRFGGGGPPVAGIGGGGPVHIGGGWHGGYGHRHHGGFIPGAIIGGAIASARYGYYYGPGYYDDQYYYDDGPVVVVPGPGDEDAVAYCMQTFRSYDRRSGTYLGYDGLRHPCP